MKPGPIWVLQQDTNPKRTQANHKITSYSILLEICDLSVKAGSSLNKLYCFWKKKSIKEEICQDLIYGLKKACFQLKQIYDNFLCMERKAHGVPRVSFSPHFDNEERLRVLVMMAAQELANGISYSGHMYAMTRASRHLTPAGELQETFGGMEQVSFIHRFGIHD